LSVKEWMKRFAARYVTLLESLLTGLDQPLAALCLLPPEEEEHQLLGWACPDETVSGPRGRPLSCVTDRPGDDMTREYPQEQLLAFVQAMANVAASDGRITEDERQQLDDAVVGIGLSPRDEQVAALIEREFQKPSRLTDIVSKIELRELRVSLLRMLVEVACADGEIANEERASVREAASAFGLDVSVADELIDWTLASIKLEQREREIMAKLL
jgi:uncharacterized tellurite resistance protein B-like protein